MAFKIYLRYYCFKQIHFGQNKKVEKKIQFGFNQIHSGQNMKWGRWFKMTSKLLYI